MAVDDYNRRAVDALQRAQALSGARSASAFSRLLAERASGTPSPSTYRRWITGEAVVPAWAVEVAAEVSGTTAQTLFEGHETGLDEWRAQIDETIGRLEGEIIEIRQHLDLPWRGRSLRNQDQGPPRERAAT